MVLALLFACTGEAGHPGGDDSAGAGEEAPLTLRFRYAVIADPHVSAATGENLDRLDSAVTWINGEVATLDLRLVLVVGDIGWGDGLPSARSSLDGLTIPYVPLNGDNEVQLGSEEAYDLVFADHYAELAKTLPDFVMGPVEVANPEVDATSWFHNVAFTYEGVRFIGVDWASRIIDPLLGELGYLHDFEGGTWPFFTEQLDSALSGGLEEHVVLFSHIPMHFSPGAFDLDKIATLVAETGPFGDQIWADLAGHYHASASETVPDAGYDLHVTDATWDDDIEVRIVEVWGNDVRFSSTTETTFVAYP